MQYPIPVYTFYYVARTDSQDDQTSEIRTPRENVFVPCREIVPISEVCGFLLLKSILHVQQVMNSYSMSTATVFLVL